MNQKSFNDEKDKTALVGKLKKNRSYRVTGQAPLYGDKGRRSLL